VTAYRAPPDRVSAIPEMLHGDKDRWNMSTERRMVRTCLIFAATVMVTAPLFPLAVKLTTFRPNAIMPFMPNTANFCESIFVAEYTLTLSSSPESQANATHWIKESGDIKYRISSGVQDQLHLVLSNEREPVDV